MESGEREYFSRKDIEEAIKYFDEIAFSQKDTSPDIADESHDFKINNGSGDRFVIRKIGNERFRIMNVSPQGHLLYVDSYCLERGSYVDPGLKPVFIYDKEFSENTQDGPSFIYGFNPAEPEIWQLSPGDRGCSVKAEKFTKKFNIGPGKYVGVENISFEIRPAEFVGIYGNSGTGKTVLIESLIAPNRTKKCSRHGKVDGGTLLIDKKSPKYLADSVAYLPQHIQFPKQIKCRELLKLGCADRRNASWYNLHNIQELLKLCTLSSDILNEKCGRLSGGQQRRLALAMALLNKNVRLIIADEPTSGLDIANEMEIMRTFRKLSRSHGITVIVVTHAVAALPLFDRVITLRKGSDGSGASLSFDSLWVSLWAEESIPEIFKTSIKQDAERIAFLSSRASVFQMPDCAKQKYQWPFRFGEYFKIPEMKCSDYLRHFLYAPIQWMKDTLSAPVFWQYSGWTINTIRLIVRQKKSLIVFLFLAVCCVLSLQLGVGNGISGHENLLTLMALCSPWLCATYASVFASELLSIFVWEKFSGLRARGFTFGVLSGLLLPSILISFVFTVGLFYRVDNDWLSKQWYDLAKYCKAGDVISFFMNSEQCEEYEEMTVSDAWRENHRPIATPPQYIIGLAELGCRSQGDDVLKSVNEIRSFKDQERNMARNDLISPLSFFMIQWAILCLICTIGTSMGVAAIAIFRDVKSSTIALVILYIAFMVFSRTFINQTSYMYALGNIPEGELEATEMQWLPSIMISFLGIGRYIFNVLSYQINGNYFLDWIPLFIWWLVSVILALVCFANKSKNWRMMSR